MDQRSPDDMQEQAVAEALNVQPEEIEVPPGIRKGLLLFELENGEFGFRPLTDGTSLMDAYALCARIQAGINADLVAQRMLLAQRAVAQKAQQAQTEKAQKPKLYLPQIGGK